MFRLFCLFMLVQLGQAESNQELEFSQDAKLLNFSSQGLAALSLEFSNFPDIEEVDLSHNDITKIEPDAFKENTKLRVINLAGNRNLQFPESGPFLETTARVLNMSQCDIEDVPGNIFAEMKNLDVLDLSENPIMFEKSLAFETMSTPPKHLIVSTVSQAGLKYMCHHADMKVTILKEKRTIMCKEVRKMQDAKPSPATGEQLDQTDVDVSIEMIEEGLIKDDTHLETMLSDGPSEGSGDEEIVDDKVISEDIPVEPSVDDHNTPNKEDQEKTVVEDATKSDTDESKLEQSLDTVEKKDEAVVSSTDIDTAEKKDEAVEKKDEAPPVIDTVEKKDETVVIDTNKDKVDVIAPIEKVTETQSAVEEPTKRVVGHSENRSNVRTQAVSNPENTDKKSDNKEELLDMNRPEYELTNGKGNVSVDMNANILDNSSIATAESKEASSGSNVILILVIGCVAMGSVLVGYKYIKDKRKPQQQVNGCAAEARELKEIRVIKDGSSAEDEPLMKTPLQDITFKEVVENGKPDEIEECKEPMNTEAPEVSAMDAICKSNAAIPSIDEEK